jgi:hypothetical protein
VWPTNSSSTEEHAVKPIHPRAIPILALSLLAFVLPALVDAAVTAPPAPTAALHAVPVPLPGGEGGIGFDDLTFSPQLGKLLVPAGRTGNLDLCRRSSTAARGSAPRWRSGSLWHSTPRPRAGLRSSCSTTSGEWRRSATRYASSGSRPPDRPRSCSPATDGRSSGLAPVILSRRVQPPPPRGRSRWG